MSVSAGAAQAFEGCPPEPAGRPHEVVGDGSPRWMVVHWSTERCVEDRTRLTGRLVRRPALTLEDMSAEQVVRDLPTVDDVL